MPTIIAIAAVSGGGKTTVTRSLALALPNAKALYFDDYDFEGPNDIVEWVEKGADCNEWKLAPLLTDLNTFMSIKAVEYIVLDYPFSRLHHELQAIDLTVFIDTPLDIAMARRIVRDCQETGTDPILRDMAEYIARGRNAYLHMLRTVKPNSDLIIDGSLPVHAIVEEICSKLLPTVTDDQDLELLHQYSALPNLLVETVSGLSGDDLDRCRAPGKWSIRQIVHHIVDCEMNYFQYDRYALANTEAKFHFPDFNADTWADHMEYGSRPIELELRFFALIREYIAYLCRTLPDALDRTLKHAEGAFTVRQALQHDNAHARHHIDQIVETKNVHRL